MANTYQIKSGDNLTNIAKANNTSVSALASANNIKNPNKIYAGASLSLPDIAPPGPTNSNLSNTGATTGTNTGTTSPTVISNTNKQTQVTQGLGILNTLAEGRGTKTSADGTPQYPDGAFVPEKTKTTDTSSEDTAYNTILDNLRANTDASTASSIANIQQMFGVRKQQQQDSNTRQEGKVQNALLMGGVTGQGSSAQYAPVSSEGIISAQESYGIGQLANLDSEEANLIAQAKAAQASQNYKVMQEKLKLVDDKKQEKMKVTAKLNDSIIARNNKKQEDAYQGAKDTAIASLYSQGITDAATIAGKLKEQGITATAEDIAKSLKNIVPPGLDDLVKTAVNNGATPEIISAILSSKNMADAYKAAGNYAAGGTGDVAEYNFYRAQALAAGHVPVDYLTYLQTKSSASTTGTTINNGVINGYDISSYATDPNHEERVKSIYNNLPSITTAADAQSAISTLSPKSPVTGTMVISAAQKFGVDPKLVVAMMQQDSSLGTAGKGAKTFNPGNVGNDDAGNTKNYGNWQSGVDAVAKWLSNHKASGASNAVTTILASGKFTKDQKADVVNAIKTGSDPLIVVQNQAKNIMGQTEATKLGAYETARDTLSDLGTQLAQFYALGGDTGLIKGNLEKVANSLGQVKDPALVDLATQIAGNIQVYRNAISGTAYSKQEGQDINSIFPGINKSQTLNDTILSSRKKLFDATIDSMYRGVLGSSYDDLKKDQSQNQPQSTGESLIQNEEVAKAKVDSFYNKASPDVQNAVDDLVKQGKTNAKILEYLTMKGIVKNEVAQNDKKSKLANVLGFNLGI